MDEMIMAQWIDSGLWGLIAMFSTLALLGCAIFVIQRFVYICRPDEILIFSGRENAMTDGRTTGFRVLQGGWGFRRPIVETVERMDISLISVPMQVQGAYSDGGIPLAMHAVANVKVSSNPKLVGNAIERFLGRGRDEIARVAKETLEGHLRGVVATLTPEEVNEDRLKFTNKLSEEAERDLDKLGLQLDTLKIQHVSDDRSYLDSIGRKRIAEILRQAEVAESDAVRAAEEAEAEAHGRGEVAQTNAKAAIQVKTNELRHIQAELEAKARSEEERAEQAAMQARAHAEQTLQEIRGELEQLRLEADVTIPAEIDRTVRELDAAGSAAHIAADGEAMANALQVVADAWRDSGDSAMDMYVLQNLEDIFAQVTEAAKRLEVGEVNLVDAGDGSTLPTYASSFPATVGSLLSSVCETLGVDIHRVLTGNSQPNGPSNGQTQPSQLSDVA